MVREIQKVPVVFLLGSNEGDREANLDRACELLKEQIYFSCGLVSYGPHHYPFELVSSIDIPPVSKSRKYPSEAWPRGCGLGDFLNMAVIFMTDMDPHSLLTVAKSVEQQMGRDLSLPIYDGNNSRIYRSRVIDIDIMFYGNSIVHSEDLDIPHPLLHMRRFALVPLNELIPDYIHPVLGKSIGELLNNLND